jgi:hypothetical protein
MLTQGLFPFLNQNLCKLSLKNWMNLVDVSMTAGNHKRTKYSSTSQTLFDI